jgi:phage gpG-like protein
MARRPFISRGMATAAVIGRTGSQRFSGSPYGGIAILAPFDPYFQAATYVYAADIDKLGAQFKSWKEPLMKSLMDVVMPSIKMNFAAQGRPAWPPLAKSTVVSRMRKGFARGPILVRTGLLRKVATSRQVWKVEPQFRGPGSDSLNFQINYFNQRVPYGRPNQIGAERSAAYKAKRGSRGTIRTTIIGSTADPFGFSHEEATFNPFAVTFHTPARPFIMLQPRDEIEIMEIFSEYLYVKANKYWGMMPDYRGH